MGYQRGYSALDRKEQGCLNQHTMEILFLHIYRVEPKLLQVLHLIFKISTIKRIKQSSFLAFQIEFFRSFVHSGFAHWRHSCVHLNSRSKADEYLCHCSLSTYPSSPRRFPILYFRYKRMRPAFPGDIEASFSRPCSNALTSSGSRLGQTCG